MRGLTDYDETRKRRGGRGYRTVADGKPPKKYVSYYCPNMDCRYSWTTVEGESERTVCRRCGADGVRT